MSPSDSTNATKSKKTAPSEEVPTSDVNEVSEKKRTSKKRKRSDLNEAASESAAPPAVALTGESLEDTSPQPDTTETQIEDETDVLSHAAARKKRKTEAKAALAKVSSDSTSPSKSKKDAKKKDSTESSIKRQNSVWVGNLSFKTTEDHLREFFQFVGGEVTRIKMPMKQDGPRKVNRGFAYVDFETPEAQDIAVSYSERNLDGRKLLIKKGDDFVGRPTITGAIASTADGADPSALSILPEGANSSLSRFAQKVLKRQKQPAAQTLFMGNLGFEATADSIRSFIETHEKARDAKEAAKKKKAELAAAKLDRKNKGKDIELEQEDGADDVSEEKPDAEGDSAGKEPSLVKVRVGTFEDSGNCKGFAFLDFQSIPLATAALLDPRNYYMDGRDLKLEYAGADAVRRSGLQPKTNTEGKSAARGGKGKGSQPMDIGEEGHSSRPKKTDGNVAGKNKHHRLRPGAALAGAQRETTAILPSEGKKIKF
ncbi:hypothetical protein DL93DRAFT_2088515 [Clavulina sp. PMI_390]|nr:hypothetical protein DL93DRAFT_2088515 [Clavulina sp. PMI_390]